VKIDKDAYSSATFDGTTVSASPTATPTPTPTASAPAAATKTETANPTATAPVVVNAPISPILAPTGVAEAPPAIGETTP
jgi:hypothetical protein